MTTAWERIDASDNGQAFETWLTNRQVTADEFNAWSFPERAQKSISSAAAGKQQQRIGAKKPNPVFADLIRLKNARITSPDDDEFSSAFDNAQVVGFWPQELLSDQDWPVD